MKQWIAIFKKYEKQYGVFFENIKDSNYPLYVENILANAGMLSYSSIYDFDKLNASGMLKKKNQIGMADGMATLSKKGIKKLIECMQA